jgi:hypothetical protein
MTDGKIVLDNGGATEPAPESAQRLGCRLPKIPCATEVTCA